MKVKPDPKHHGVVVELGRKDAALLAENAPAQSPFRLHKIMVPIDFSERSKKALAYAIPLAAQFKASILLAHVVQVAYGGGEFGLVDVPMLETEIRQNAERELGELAKNIAPKIAAAEVRVRTGRPVTEIVDLAKQEAIDLIILSTHGHTGLKHMLLGSIAENVVRHAPCPVLVVRSHERDFVPSV